MTTATLNSGSVYGDQSVGQAVRELGSAATHLLHAVWAGFARFQLEAKHVVTALEEADAMRAYADTVFKDDPRHACDLYAAADRHENQALAA